MAINRFEVYPVKLDPSVGVEMRKTRPALVVSPDELNHHIRTVIIAPLTTRGDRIRAGSLAASRERMGRLSSTKSGRWISRA